MKNIKKFKSKLIDCSVIALIVAIFYIFNVPCLFKLLFKIQCPGCGITRAYISLMHLDFAKAFELNPMFWSVPFLILYYFTDGKIFKQKWLNSLLFYLIIAGFLINWIIKLI